jgi:hypothetical protein
MIQVLTMSRHRHQALPYVLAAVFCFSCLASAIAQLPFNARVVSRIYFERTHARFFTLEQLTIAPMYGSTRNGYAISKAGSHLSIEVTSALVAALTSSSSR